MPKSASRCRILHFPSPAAPAPSLSLQASAAIAPVQAPALPDASAALHALAQLAATLYTPGVLAPRYAHLAAECSAALRTLRPLVPSPNPLAPSLHPLAPSPRPAPAPVRNAPPPTNALRPARPGRRAPVRSPSAGEAIERCAPRLQQLAGAAVAVHISAERHLPPLRIADEALARVLGNLVNNAREAMPAGGTVRITARRALSRQRPAVLVHVTDNGSGIPAYALGSIWQPGFTSRASEGHPRGMGLPQVRALVEGAGGAVRVASTRRRGTTFELRLPACLPGTSVTGEEHIPAVESAATLQRNKKSL